MSPLLSRFFGGKNKQEVGESSFVPNTIHLIEEHQRVSIVGWIANKLGQLVGLDHCDNGKLLVNVLNKDFTKLNLEDEEEYLFYLANCLVTWIENEEDVYLNIKKMNLSSNYHIHLLDIYELVKSNENVYLNKTKIPTKEITHEDKEWKIYRDVLHAASQRKFLLIKDEELKEYITGEVLCKEPVIEKSDIPVVRNKAKEVLESCGIHRGKVASYILLISEGITNILKHAKDGRLTITKTKESLNIIIEDHGTGFPLDNLPYMVLTEGYSTKKSLGQGFTLMLKLTDQLLLKTSSKGSTIVLALNIEKEENEKNDL